jgi:hypothetical protein
MTIPNPSGWADPTFGSATSPSADPASPASPASGAVRPPSPAPPPPPVFGQAAVPANEPAPAWTTADGGYPGYTVPGYGSGPYGYGYGYPPPVAVRPTNGLAVAAMVVSIVGMAGVCAYGIGGLVGIAGAILGHVSRRQIRQRGEQGDGMATAGIVVGWIAAVLGVIFVAVIVLIIAAASQTSSEF